jgi:hypothetical protein
MTIAARSLSLVVLLSMLCASCASTGDDPAAHREERTYRTGSNIPVNDYGAANSEVATPDAINPAIVARSRGVWLR